MSNKKIPEHQNTTGTPDMRFKENRDDPNKVAEHNERQEAGQGVPGDGKNKDGSADMRLKENREAPQKTSK